MAWSTRQVAELAGTSPRAVRHYHQVGLLAEPDRRANGYKQYGVAHLIRLVRIKRLADLGFSLDQIAAMGQDDRPPDEDLRALDARLLAAIERLGDARTEVARILDRSASTDLPPDFVAPDTAARLSPADRSLMVVLTRVLGPRGKEIYADLLRQAPDEFAMVDFADFDGLPADADESTREHLAVRLVPHIRAIGHAHPGLREFSTDAPGGPRFADRTIADAVSELYNSAQLDVLDRVRGLLSAGRTG